MAEKNETNQPVSEATSDKEPESEYIQEVANLTTEIKFLLAKNQEQFEEIRELHKMLADKNNPEYLIIIPYKASEAQGNEIHLAIHGWLKHFKERFRLIIIGDDPGDIDYTLPENVSEITHLPHSCQTDNPPLDIIAKLQEVIIAYPEYPGIILTNDDIYPVTDFDITEVKLLKSDGLLTDRKSTGNLYAENRAKTLKLLQAEHLPIYDYGCHTPVYLETAKLLELIDKFNMTEDSFLIASLYFNYFYPNRVPLKLDLQYDNLKAGVYRQNANLTMLKDISHRKIWISNSVAGWSQEFEQIMTEILA